MSDIVASAVCCVTSSLAMAVARRERLHLRMRRGGGERPAKRRASLEELHAEFSSKVTRMMAASEASRDENELLDLMNHTPPKAFPQPREQVPNIDGLSMDTLTDTRGLQNCLMKPLGMMLTQRASQTLAHMFERVPDAQVAAVVDGIVADLKRDWTSTQNVTSIHRSSMPAGSGLGEGLFASNSLGALRFVAAFKGIVASAYDTDPESIARWLDRRVRSRSEARFSPHVVEMVEREAQRVGADVGFLSTWLTGPNDASHFAWPVVRSLVAHIICKCLSDYGIDVMAAATPSVLAREHLFISPVLYDERAAMANDDYRRGKGVKVNCTIEPVVAVVDKTSKYPRLPVYGLRTTNKGVSDNDELVTSYGSGYWVLHQSLGASARSHVRMLRSLINRPERSRLADASVFEVMRSETPRVDIDRDSEYPDSWMFSDDVWNEKVFKELRRIPALRVSLKGSLREAYRSVGYSITDSVLEHLVDKLRDGRNAIGVETLRTELVRTFTSLRAMAAVGMDFAPSKRHRSEDVAVRGMLFMVHEADDRDSLTETCLRHLLESLPDGSLDCRFRVGSEKLDQAVSSVVRDHAPQEWSEANRAELARALDGKRTCHVYAAANTMSLALQYLLVRHAITVDPQDRIGLCTWGHDQGSSFAETQVYHPVFCEPPARDKARVPWTSSAGRVPYIIAKDIPSEHTETNSLAIVAPTEWRWIRSSTQVRDAPEGSDQITEMASFQTTWEVQIQDAARQLIGEVGMAVDPTPGPSPVPVPAHEPVVPIMPPPRPAVHVPAASPDQAPVPAPVPDPPRPEAAAAAAMARIVAQMRPYKPPASNVRDDMYQGAEFLGLSRVGPNMSAAEAHERNIHYAWGSHPVRPWLFHTEPRLRYNRGPRPSAIDAAQEMPVRACWAIVTCPIPDGTMKPAKHKEEAVALPTGTGQSIVWESARAAQGYKWLAFKDMNPALRLENLPRPLPTVQRR